MWDEWWYESPAFFSGFVSTLPTDSERDPVQELRKVVEEVTGKPLESPPPKRIGFIWN